jgi:hypothetical protein
MLGITGGNVAIVHQRLVVLGIEVPPAERYEDHFGPGTEAAIRRVQVETGLPLAGVVDEATARACGLPGVQPKSIQGVVCKPDGTPLAGIAVRLSHQGLRGETVAGATRSGGGCTAETLTALRFTRRATVLVRNHLPLLQHVQQLRVARTMAATSDRARLDEGDWGTLLRAWAAVVPSPETHRVESIHDGRRQRASNPMGSGRMEQGGAQISGARPQHKGRRWRPTGSTALGIFKGVARHPQWEHLWLPQHTAA